MARPVGGDDLKKILVIGGQVLVTVVVTWFIASQAGLTASKLRTLDFAAWDPSWGLFALSCAVLLAGYLGNAYLWGRIVRGLGEADLRTAVAVRVFMVANLGRYVPGKVWQIAGLVAMARSRGVSGATATGAAVLGQGIGLAAAALVGLGSLWTVAEGQAWRWAIPLVLVAGVVVGLAPPVFHAVVDAWFRLAKTGRPERLSPAHAAGWMMIALGTWVVYAAAFWLFVESMGLDVAALPTGSAFAAAYVLGYVMVFAPAGIGVREGFLVVLMAPQIGAGAAGAIAVIARLWTTVIEVVPAAAFWARHVTTAHGGSNP